MHGRTHIAYIAHMKCMPYTHMHPYIHAHIHAYTQTNMHIHTYTYAGIHAYIHPHTYTHTYEHIRTYRGTQSGAQDNGNCACRHIYWAIHTSQAFTYIHKYRQSYTQPFRMAGMHTGV